MIRFICSSDLKTIRKKLILLYLFNVSDIILTYFLLSTGFFEEVNILLLNIIDNTIVTLSAKVIFIFLLIKYISYRLQKANIRQLNICNKLIMLILSIYIIINFSHLFWILYVFIIINWHYNNY